MQASGKKTKQPKTMYMVVLEIYVVEGMSNLCFDVAVNLRGLRARHTHHVLCRKAQGKIQTLYNQ